MKADTLAWRKFPEPDGLEYNEKDLYEHSKVIELFDYCQILEATISGKGWQFLFEHYELKGIIKIDSKSGWLEDEDLGQWIVSIFYHSLISGFDPMNNEFGNYDENTGIFINTSGYTREIDWKEIYNMKDDFTFRKFKE